MLPAVILTGFAGLLAGLVLGRWRFGRPDRRAVGRAAAAQPSRSNDSSRSSSAVQDAQSLADVSATDSVSSSAIRLGRSHEKLQNRLPTVESKLVQQMQDLESRLKAERVDRLTGLPDRRAFDEDLCRRLAEWRRRGTPLSIMLLDLDDFHKTNELYGRAAASTVLRSVSTVLSGSLREMDLLARMAQDEFAVLMPATTGGEAMSAAKRVRAEVAAATFWVDGSALDATVSVGLAEVMEGDHATLLMERADAALDAARRSGGNCVYFHNGAANKSIPAFEPSGFLPAMPRRPS